MVLEAHKWNHVSHRPPRGFHNLGNTCFLNATLQCLAYIPPFCQTLIAISESKMKNNMNGVHQKMYQGQKITSTLCSLFRQAHGFDISQSGSAIAPKNIVNALPTIGSCGSRNGYKFRPGRQEDAHEFLVHLLDAMNDGELRAAGINQHASGWRDRLPVSRLDETTFIHRIFGGYFRSQVRCRKCNYRSNTYDPFLDLSLEVSKKSSNSVLNALSEFTRKETLDAENQWKCSGCKKYVCATKQLTVFRPPLTLCIQLKRFAFDSGTAFGMNGFKFSKFHHGLGGSKITKPIEFPADLDLPLSDGRSCAYSLTGIVIHVGGSASSGHYTAYVKQPGKRGSNQWYHMDDSFVEPVSEKTVLRQRDAYVLFYCRKEVKLEFPVPPPRSMTASEATEFGRAKARARADSFTNEETMKNHDESQQSEHNFELVSRAETSIRPEDVQSKIRFISAVKQDLSGNNSKNTTEIPSKEDAIDNSSSSVASNSSGEKSFNNDNGDSRTAKVIEKVHASHKVHGKTSDNSSSSTSDSSSRSSGSSSDDDLEEEVQTADRDFGEIGKLLKHDGALVESSGQKVENDESLSSTSEVAEPIQEKGHNKKQGSFGKDMAPSTTASTGNTTNRTRILLDNSDSRGKVQVMLGPRKRKIWKSNVTSLPSKKPNFHLLGNVGVSRWDDDGTESGAAEKDLTSFPNHSSVVPGINSERKKIVEKLDKNERSRKRKMHLDRWDALLDQGKNKKVKIKSTAENHTMSSDPAKNIFQRIQSGVQRLGRGKAKGMFRVNKPTNKKATRFKNRF
jgi:ubiquitin carboxyl-terminal hydrolase 36/42